MLEPAKTPALRLSLSRKLSPLMLTIVEWWRTRSSIAAVSTVSPAKALSHLPVVVDPSHGTGKRAYVPPMALASLAAGADGLLIEAHPEPDQAMSDGAQSLDFAGLDKLLGQLRRMAELLGRKM